MLDKLVLSNNATQQAFVILAKCLLNNGALKPGQFSQALKITFNEAEADWEKLDYTLLQLLADALDRAETQGRTV